MKRLRPVDRLRRLPPWAWLALIALALRLPTLASENLWYDEAFTARVAQTDWPHLWPAILGDVHPPLWYALEWAIAHTLGASEFWLRLPALAFGILAVAMVWRLALHVYIGHRAAFVAGLLAAFWPAALYYSQEARMYSMLLFAVLWAIDSATQEQWSRFALAGILACYSHNIGVVHIAVIGAVVFLYRARFAILVIPRNLLLEWWRPFSLSVLAIVAAWAPWAAVGLRAQVAALGAGYWLPPLTLPAVAWPYLAMSAGVRLADPLQLVVYSTFLIMAGIGLFESLTHKWLYWWPGSLVLIVLFVTPALTAGISFVWRNIYMHRTLLPSVSLLALPIAYALVNLGPRPRRLAQVAFIPVLAIAVISHYFPANGRSDMNHWLDPIEYRPGDVVYHLTVDSDILVSYYRPALPSRLFPESNDLSQSLTDQTKTALGFTMTPFDDLGAQGFKRAWLVTNLSPMTSLQELDAYNAIMARYHPILVQDTGPGIAPERIWLVALQ